MYSIYKLTDHRSRKKPEAEFSLSFTSTKPVMQQDDKHAGSLFNNPAPAPKFCKEHKIFCFPHSKICMTQCDSAFTPRSDCVTQLQSLSLSDTCLHAIIVPTWVGKRSRASDTLWSSGRPFPFPESPFTRTPPCPPSFTPPPPSESDEGDAWAEVSVSISLTDGGLSSTWKSAEILQLLETSKRARLMKNGSTCESEGRLQAAVQHVPLLLYNISL